MRLITNSGLYEQDLRDGSLRVELRPAPKGAGAQLTRCVRLSGLYLQQVHTFRDAHELRDFIQADEYLDSYPDFFNAIWRNAARMFDLPHDRFAH